MSLTLYSTASDQTPCLSLPLAPGIVMAVDAQAKTEVIGGTEGPVNEKTVKFKESLEKPALF